MVVATLKWVEKNGHPGTDDEIQQQIAYLENHVKILKNSHNKSIQRNNTKKAQDIKENVANLSSTQNYLNQNKDIVLDIVVDGPIPNKIHMANHFILNTDLNRLLIPISKISSIESYHDLDNYIYEFISGKSNHMLKYNIFYEYQRLCNPKKYFYMIVIPHYRGVAFTEQHTFFTFNNNGTTKTK